MSVSAGARRESAVLVPILRDAEGRLRMVLIRRAAGGIHGGQLAFPGGVRDARDASPLDTALRESHEEIGLERSAVTLLATLPVVETRTSNYRIAPFLARIERPAQWTLEPREVAEVLEVEVAAFADPNVRGEAIEQFATWREPQRIEFFRIGEHRLWGASYRIFEPLLPRLLAGEWAV